jgi:hypothetical protein
MKDIKLEERKHTPYLPCSIKTGEFSYAGDDLIFWSGSEDFKAYGWRLPNLEYLRGSNYINNPGVDDVGKFSGVSDLIL